MLIVDDDGVIGVLYTEMFNALGYQSVVFDAPNRALEYYKAHSSRINYVVMTEKQTHGSGYALYHKLEQLDPLVNALVVCGEDAECDEFSILSQGPIVFIHKPQFAAGLFKKFQEIFDVSLPTFRLGSTSPESRSLDKEPGE